MSRFDMEGAINFIREGDDFLIVSHVQPDGDAVSSLLAAALVVRSLGKRCTTAIADRVPPKLMFLPGSDLIRNARTEEPPGRLYSRVIAVDCADFSRMGMAANWIGDDARLLNIDHHPTNDGFGDVTLIRPEAAATAEILHELVTAMGVRWTKPLAECIYTGILTDTGGFRYTNATPASLRIASEMMEHGASGSRIAEHLLERVSLAHVILLKKALATLSFTEGNRIGWVTVTRSDMEEANAQSEDLEGLVNYPRNIEGVEVGILFKEVDENKVKVSLRSAGAVDVAAFAKSFGGGGHVRAAGITLHMPLQEAVETVVGGLRGLMA
jgi:phosphoesterase RecJ-like protein